MTFSRTPWAGSQLSKPLRTPSYQLQRVKFDSRGSQLPAPKTAASRNTIKKGIMSHVTRRLEKSGYMHTTKYQTATKTSTVYMNSFSNKKYALSNNHTKLEFLPILPHLIITKSGVRTVLFHKVQLTCPRWPSQQGLRPH